MLNHVKKTLELFVEKVKELTEDEFTQFMSEFGYQFTYQFVSANQQMTVQTVAPTETMNKAFLITYRMFVQNSEHMRIIDPKKTVSNVLLDPSLSEHWREQVNDVAGKIHSYLLKKPSGQITINLANSNGELISVEELTRWDILEALLYGEYSHATQRERLTNWLSGSFAAILKGFLLMEFREILLYTLDALHYLAYYAQIELGLPIPDD